MARSAAYLREYEEVLARLNDAGSDDAVSWLEGLLSAARNVVGSWESGDLADAVSELAAFLT